MKTFFVKVELYVVAEDKGEARELVLSELDSMLGDGPIVGFTHPELSDVAEDRDE